MLRKGLPVSLRSPDFIACMLTPTLERSPPISAKREMTPIEPVIVEEWTTIESQAEATYYPLSSHLKNLTVECIVLPHKKLTQGKLQFGH